MASVGKPTIKQRAWFLLKCAIALAAIAFVLSYITWADLILVLKTLALPYLGLALTFYALLMLANAVRNWLLIDTVAFREVFKLSLFHKAISYVVANSAGITSYVAALRIQHQVPVSIGAGSVLMTKCGELIALTVALVLSFVLLRQQIAQMEHVVVMLLVLLAVAMAGIIATVVLGERVVERVTSTACAIGCAEHCFYKKIEAGLLTLAKWNAKVVRRRVLPLVGISLLTFALTVVWAYYNARAFHIEITIVPILFIVTLTHLIGLLPIQVFGGVGIVEITGLYLFGLFGFGESEMAPVLVGTRLLYYVVNLLIMCCFPFAWKRPQTNQE